MPGRGFILPSERGERPLRAPAAALPDQEGTAIAALERPESVSPLTRSRAISAAADRARHIKKPGQWTGLEECGLVADAVSVARVCGLLFPEFPETRPGTWKLPRVTAISVDISGS